MRDSKDSEQSSGMDESKSAERQSRRGDTKSLDEKLNRAIIAMLQKDGRRPFAEIAQKVGVSEGTVRNRVLSLKEKGLLQIVAIVDPVAAQFDMEVMLCLEIAPNANPEAVAERLSALSECVFVLWVSGKYDLMIEVITDSREEFLQFMSREIYGHGDIASVDTMVGLKNFKNQFLLKHDWS